jgi:hypothetical protein
VEQSNSFAIAVYGGGLHVKPTLNNYETLNFCQMLRINAPELTNKSELGSGNKFC